jgi:hypothetical protein
MTAVATGVVAATILVGVALAVVLVQITANVSSNEFATTTSPTTTTTIPAPSNGLEVSLSNGSGIGSCGPFSTGPLALAGISFDLNSTSSQSTGQFLCVKNAGNIVIESLTISPNLVSSGEADCSTDEGTVDPEGVTCGTAGELAGLLQFVFLRTDADDFDCLGAVFGGGNMLSGGQLGIGNTCVYSISLQFAGSPTDDEKLAASTDTAEFSIDVTASP